MSNFVDKVYKKFIMKLDVKNMLFLVAAVVVGSFVYSKVAPMIGGEGFEMDDED